MGLRFRSKPHPAKDLSPGAPQNFVAYAASSTVFVLTWQEDPNKTLPDDFDLDYSIVSAVGPWISIPINLAYTYPHTGQDVTVRHWWRLVAKHAGFASNSTITTAIAYRPVFTVAPPTHISPASGDTIQFTATDVDGGALTYSLAFKYRSDISINSGTGLVTVPATAAGTNGNITVRCTDSIGLFNEVSCSLQVLSLIPSSPTFIIPSNVTSWSGATLRTPLTGGAARAVKAGDLIYLSAGTSTTTATAGTRGPLKLSIKGSASGYVTIKNPPTGVVTITGASTRMLDLDTCEYVTIDGSNYSGATHGIVITRTSSSSTVEHFVKCMNLCKFITIRYVEVSGKVTSWTGTPAPGMPIGMSLHHNTLPRSTSGTPVYQEGRVVEHCYVHNTAGEAVYCGPNFVVSANPMPMKNVVIRNNVFEDTGRDGMQIKSLWEGPCIVEGNTIRRVGRNRYDQDAGQRAGILLESALGIVRNNKIYDTGTNGIQCYTNVGPSTGTTYGPYGSFSSFEVEVYNNLIVSTGREDIGTPTPNPGKGITAGSASAALVPVLPKFYSNTLVDIEDVGINIDADQKATGAFARNNLLVNCGTNTSDGTGIIISDNTASSNPSALFVAYDNANTYANSDFHLKAATAAAGGTAGTHYSTTDIEGTTRVSPDRGAYEYA